MTRLIAGAFRESGRRTVAKVTGTSPRLIYPDGTETELQRSGPANISEQLEIVRAAADLGAEVLVIECMALLPELQRVSQHSIVEGTCAVVTNVRPDHQDVMGETLEEIAWCLGSVAPRDGVLVTAEQYPRIVHVLGKRCAQVGARLVQVDLSEAPSADEFGRDEFPENLAIALAVCDMHGLDRDVALRGMRDAWVDPGALSVVTVAAGPRQLTLVNAFAANDYVSTEAIVHDVSRKHGGVGPILLANARRDRPRCWRRSNWEAGGAVNGRHSLLI